MLDDIERRRLLVDPAGKHPLPLLVRPLHIELDEGAGQRLRLPRRRFLAGAQPHDRILDPHRLTGLQHQVADDAIALVEEAEHRDPLRHWRDPRHRDVVGRLVHRDRPPGGIVALGRLLMSSAARDDQREDCRKNENPHVQSGVQGL
jgi:hypothetical protein